MWFTPEVTPKMHLSGSVQKPESMLVVWVVQHDTVLMLQSYSAYFSTDSFEQATQVKDCCDFTYPNARYMVRITSAQPFVLVVVYLVHLHRLAAKAEQFLNDLTARLMLSHFEALQHNRKKKHHSEGAV